MYFTTYPSLLILIGFVGFALGRCGDKLGGHLFGPHHWLYGLFFVLMGTVFYNHFWGIAVISFGIGHFISDLNDFLHLRFYGYDVHHEWRFWSIL